MSTLEDMQSTIAAVSTPPGTGGIAVVRVSGPDAIAICDRIWRGKRLADCKTHTVHLGDLLDSDGSVLDTAVATVFRAPHSFTGEDTVELSVHGSPWIQREVVLRLIESGARGASAGEFTRRAFVNGRLDLAQAEGVADMIAVSSRAAQKIAARQMKGGFSKSLDAVREEMVTLASLLELELDFSEEDVEFADRTRLMELSGRVKAEVDRLASSFRAGHALKEGVNVVIAGCPNAGKSTLLNALLGDDKAIVSDVAGTTRDVIEDTAEIDGVLFRFVDTAGLRDADDAVEKIGIERACKRIESADIVIALIDAGEDVESRERYLDSVLAEVAVRDDVTILRVLNKSDLISAENQSSSVLAATSSSEDDALSGESYEMSFEGSAESSDVLLISAKEGSGLDMLRTRIVETARRGLDLTTETIVTNVRHYESLCRTSESLARFRAAMESGLPADLLAQDLREAIHHLATITGAITTDTLLHTIFSRFCIGK